MPSRPSEIRDRSLRDRRSTSHDPETSESPPKPSVAKDKTREKTFMDQWVEPAIATKASYEDHHGAPYGVLEHMQPLGEPPNAKVKGRVKSEVTRKSFPGRSAAATGLDGAQETPEGTPAPPVHSFPAVNKPAQPAVVIDDERDADYAPKGKKKETKPRARKEKQQGETAQLKSRKSKTPRQSQTPSARKGKVYDAEKLKRVVDSAKERAMDVGKPDLAAAVHEIWVESLTSERLTDLLEAILTQTASPEQTQEFQVYVKAAKRRLKEAKEKSRDQPAGGANSAQALPLRSPSKPAATPTAEPRSSALPSTEPADPPKSKLKLTVKSPQKTAKNRSNQGGKMSASPLKKPTDGNESDSSELTDLTEDEEDAMEVDEQDELVEGPTGAPARVNGFQAKDHAAERGSLVAPERKLKRSSAEADMEEDERENEIAAKKQKLGAAVNRDVPHQESDIRGKPNAQSRLSRAAKGIVPPVKLEPNASRVNSVRGSRAGTDSPLSSPAVSRMSTPQHQPQHVPKTKVAGKKAKTKTS